MLATTTPYQKIEETASRTSVPQRNHSAKYNKEYQKILLKSKARRSLQSSASA
jgi:hypothetical protein